MPITAQQESEALHARKLMVGFRTSKSGKASFSNRMVRCESPFLLKASSPVEVFRWSGVCAHPLSS